MKIPFSKISLSGNESKYIHEVLASGWLTTSSKALAFEQNFAEFVGARFACAVNSCTAALHLAIEASGVREGDKVLVPSLTFTASAEIIRYMGADPVFTDVDYGTGNITPDILAESLHKNRDIKALVLVHYGGQAAVMQAENCAGIADICRERGIILIEDAAHAFPTRFNGKFAGTFGMAGCYSFYANKTITTGEGGMLVTDNEDWFKRFKIMRLHGISRDIWERFTSNGSSWEYDVVAPGFKYNMPDINAAVGLAQLEKASWFRSQRQRCAAYYMENLKTVSMIDLPICLDSPENHAWHLFPIIIRADAPVSRDEFINQMAIRGIGTSVHYKPLYRMKYYQETYQLKAEDFPNTEMIWKGTVSLPIYPDLHESDLQFICNAIKEILNCIKAPIIPDYQATT
jgi:dTDP-4-amino-4,6-dideoxygalactose transaminase